MPHVTALAKKYEGKATVLGISIWERPKENTEDALYAEIQQTINQMGEKMDYTVGAEGLGKEMATTWMTPARQPGIPCAFIVDKTGTIAWIGLPAKMDAALDAVVNDTWDIPAERKRLLAAAAEDAVKNKYTNAIMAARRANDPAGVLKAIDVAEQNNALPEHPDLLSIRLDAMFKLDPASAVTYIETLTAPTGQLTKTPRWTWGVLRVLPLDYAGANAPGITLTSEQYQTLAKSLEAPTNASPNMHHFAAYAALCAKAGDNAKASEYQAKALAEAEKSPDKEQLAKWFTAQREKLTAYRAATH